MSCSSATSVLADLFGVMSVHDAEGTAPGVHEPAAYDGLKLLLHALKFERTAEKVGAALVACAASPKAVLEFAGGVSIDDRLFNLAVDMAIRLGEMHEFIVALSRVSAEVAPMYAAEKLVSAALSAGISMAGPNSRLLDGVYSKQMMELIDRPSLDLRRDRLRLPFKKIGAKVWFNMHDHTRDPAQQLLDMVPSLRTMLREVRVHNARLVIAGGAPLGAVTGVMDKISDVDIFVVSEHQDVAAATRLVIESILHLLKTSDSCTVSLTPTVVTVCIPCDFRGNMSVQFVLRLYTSAPQVLLSFDMAPSRFLMEADGQLSCTRSAAWAVANKLTLPDPLMTTYSARAFKYSKKGLPFAIPDMDWLIPAAGHVMYMDPIKLKQTMRRTSISGILAFSQLIHTSRRRIRLDADMYGESESKPRVINNRLFKAWDGPHDAAWSDELAALMATQWCVTDPCVRMAGASGASYLR